MAKQLSCEEYIEVEARTGQGLDKLQLESKYEKYFKKLWEEEVLTITKNMKKNDKKKEKKKKKFFFF